jgi:hypothetical protein
MRTHYRAIAVALALAASTSVFAQSSDSAGTSTRNSLARGEDVFSQPMTRSPQTFGRGAFDNTGIGRPNPRSQHQVTPVPEPSQWAMMLAGLALVGFIVRRNARKSQD